MDQCREFKKNVFEFLDGTLDQELSAGMMDHLRQCGDCRSFYEEEKDLQEETYTRVSKADEMELKDETIDEITTRIMEIEAEETRCRRVEPESRG